MNNKITKNKIIINIIRSSIRRISIIFYSVFIVFIFLLINSISAPNAASNPNSNSNMFKGKELFIKHCSQCHRKDGSGIKKIYPPIKFADYIKKQTPIELLRGMLFGRSGKIVVNGETYNGVMTTEVDATVTDDDIAILLNYVLSELNTLSQTVKAKDVKEARRAGKLPIKK